MNKYLSLLILLCLSLRISLSAQLPPIQKIELTDGLSNNYIQGITQDKQGYIWFATDEGLNRFDGTKVYPYYRDKSNCISGNELNGVIDDPHDPNDSRSLITNDVTRVTPASDGNIWLSTYWQGIDYLNKRTGKFIHYNKNNVKGLPDNQFWTILDGNDGFLYAGHVRNGLSIIDIKRRTAINFKSVAGDPNSLPGNEINALYKDNYGRIWIGTDHGLAIFDSNRQLFYRITAPNVNLNHPVWDIIQTTDNKIWVAMDFGGIAIIDLAYSSFKNIGNLPITYIGVNNGGLSYSRIRRLFQDNQKNIWIGTYGGGINFVRNTLPLFEKYEYPSSDSKLPYSMLHGKAACVTTNKIGDVWVGTDEGHICLFKNKIPIVRYNLGGGAPIQCIYNDSEGTLWVGLYYGGIAYLKSGSNQFVRLLEPIDVRNITQNSDRDLTVSTSSGIYIINTTTGHTINHVLLGNSLIRAILQDKHGNYWVGTYGDGLYVLNSKLKPIRHYDMASGFPSNTINALHTDIKNQLWVATGDGIVCFDNPLKNSFRIFGRQEGLPGAFVCSIEHDTVGNIWFSTNRGISCFISSRKTFSHFDTRDNLPSGSFCSGNSSRDEQGKIYFGSMNGICIFQPEHVLRIRQHPAAMFTRLRIPASGRSTADSTFFLIPGKTLKLSHTQNSFDIAFTIPDFALKHEVEFAYTLDGLWNEQWFQADNYMLSFRNIPPGKYHLRLKTRIRNQEWSNDATQLDIIIVPPIYLRWWAKFFYLVLAILLAYYLLQLYNRMLRTRNLYELEKRSHENEVELNNERIRFYTNITHELRTPLTLMIGPLEDILTSGTLPIKEIGRIKTIKNSADRLLNLVNQLLEFRRTETQNRRLCISKRNLADTVCEIGLKYKELNTNKEITISIKIPDNKDFNIYYDPEIIQIVLDNLVANALKYTDRGNIDISLNEFTRSEKAYIVITVRDTGRGIGSEALPHIFERYYQEKGNHQASGTGIGLALVKNLVILHEGEITVDSILGEGSVFKVYLLRDNIYPQALHAEAEISSDKVLIQNSAKEINGTEDDSTDERPIVLIVEDNADIRQYIADILNKDFETVQAVNGQEGLDKALELTPDIIVTDIMMPEMDGIELCKQLRKDIRTSHIPIIGLTAKDGMKDKEEGYLVGMDSYLTKPFNASLLHSRITNLLNIRRNLAQHFGTRNSTSKTIDNQRSVLFKKAQNELDRVFLERIDTLIEERLATEKIDIGFLSDRMCMSNSTLYRKMKAITGMSANEYIRMIRMRFAEQFLLEGKYSITEIAFKVGFSNTNYFRQCFKEEFGCNPSEFLKKLPPSDIQD